MWTLTALGYSPWILVLVIYGRCLIVRCVVLRLIVKKFGVRVGVTVVWILLMLIPWKLVLMCSRWNGYRLVLT